MSSAMNKKLRYSQIRPNLNVVKLPSMRKILFIFFLSFSGIACGKSANEDLKTKEYITNLDISKFERNGSDYANPKYSPLRLGKPMEQIDKVFDYDFERIVRTEKYLKGIDRKRVLRHIFATITDGARTNTEKHLRILKFLHNIILPGFETSI